MAIIIAPENREAVNGQIVRISKTASADIANSERRTKMKNRFSRWSVAALESPDVFDHIPKIIWGIIAVMFLVLVGAAFAQDVPKVGDTEIIASGTATPQLPGTVPISPNVAPDSGVLVPGGLEPSALNDGTPAVQIDAAALAAKGKGDTRNWLVRAKDATLQNIKDNPKTWAAGAAAVGAALAGGIKSSSGGGDEKKAVVTQKNPKQPRPDVAVSGANNNVELPSDAIGNGNGIVVSGHDNNVQIRDEPQATSM